MVNDPTVEELVTKMGTVDENGNLDQASKYALCVVASKRARQIIERRRSKNMVHEAGEEKEIVAACREILNGNVTYTKD